MKPRVKSLRVDSRPSCSSFSILDLHWLYGNVILTILRGTLITHVLNHPVHPAFHRRARFELNPDVVKPLDMTAGMQPVTADAPVFIKEKIINIRVDADLKKQAKKLAENDGRSLSNWILRLIQKQIKMSEKASGAKRD